MQNESLSPFISSQTLKEEDRKGNKATIMSDHLETCIYISTTVFLAEFMRRIFRFSAEFWFYGKRYLPDKRLMTIFKRTFSCSQLTQISIIFLLILTVIETAIRRRFPFVPAKFLLYMPLYWLYNGIQLSHSNLDYADFIRSRNGMDYGEGMASSYFHGYINLTMPSFTGGRGIRERIELFEANNNAQFVVNRLVILIPNTMYTAPKIESRILEKRKVCNIEKGMYMTRMSAKKLKHNEVQFIYIKKEHVFHPRAMLKRRLSLLFGLETVIKNRAGVMRPYQSDVYQFTEEINGIHYYIAMEGATPLLTFFEAIRSEVTATWQMREFQREILFKFYQSLKQIINESPETKNEVELIFYDVNKPDGTPEDIGEYLKAYFKRQLSTNHDKTD